MKVLNWSHLHWIIFSREKTERNKLLSMHFYDKILFLSENNRNTKRHTEEDCSSVHRRRAKAQEVEW